MYLKENRDNDSIPLYQVKELTMEEALLVLAAEKEQFGYEREMIADSEREKYPA
ncbi:MAG: hypothetical protein ABW166_04170 [Sedimenticola sp.]